MDKVGSKIHNMDPIRNLIITENYLEVSYII
jgi:hypothetical protein